MKRFLKIFFICLFGYNISEAQKENQLEKLSNKQDTAKSKFYLKLGESEFEVGNYEAANGNLNLAIKFDTSNAAAYRSKGLIEFAQKKYGNAISSLTKAIIKGAPPDTLLFITKGESNRLNLDFEGAVSDFNQAIRMGVKFFQVYRSRGLVNYHLGKYSQAISDLSVSLNSFGTDTLALKRRGYSYYAVGKYQNAITDFIRYFENGGNDFYVYYLRGAAYFSLCNTREFSLANEAIADFTKYNSRNTKNLNIFYLIGVAYSFSNDSTLARQYFEKSLESFPDDPQTLSVWSVLENNIHNYGMSLKLLNQMVNVQPEEKSKLLYYRFGIAKSGVGDTIGAIEDFKSALEIDKDFTEVYAARVKLFFNSSRYDDQLKKDLDSLINKVKNSKRVGLFHSSKSLVYLREGNTLQANQEIEKAIQIDQSVAIFYVIKALVDEQQRRSEKTILSAFDKAIQLSTESKVPLFLEAFYFKREGKFKKACELIKDIDASSVKIKDKVCNRGNLESGLRSILYPYMKEAIVDIYF